MNYKVKGSDLASVADAIRTKGSTSAQLDFPDGFVSAIGNIPTGGGSTLITKNITANGTYNASSDSADGYSSVTVAVPSKLVKGTFKGTTAGAVQTVTIPYTGSGYPVIIVIYPSEGAYNPDGTFYSTIDYRAILSYCAIKAVPTSTPNYSGGASDKAMVSALVKNSTSDATATTVNRNNSFSLFNSGNAQAYSCDMVRMNSATSMSVIMSNNAYGFAPNVEYTYEIIYSS